MATTQIADVIVPAVYMTYTAVNSPEKTAFFDSGVAVRNPMLDTALDEGGMQIDVPFWKDLDSTVEPNYSSDDPTQNASPQKVQAGEQLARKAFLNQGYSAADLVVELAGSDPMQQVRNRFGTYWMRQWQRRIIATALGTMNRNIASENSDMVVNRAAESVAGTTDANLFARGAFTAAAFTLGDMFGEIGTIAVHSIVAKRMIDNDDIVYIPDSQGNLTIPTYLGKRVVIDDQMPIIPGTTNGYKYVSILFGNGAIGYGEGSPKVPVEVEREARQGNGGGVETLWERKSWLIHPFGYKFTSNTVSAQSATLANLRLAGNWQRVIERKNVPLAFLITNG